MSQPSTASEEAIPILHVRDAAATAAWYEQLGFDLVHVHRFEPGLPAFATIERGGVTLFLSEHTGDARPGALVYLRQHGVHDLAERFGVTPDDNPWGSDFEVTDPDGNRIRVGTPSWW